MGYNRLFCTLQGASKTLFPLHLVVTRGSLVAHSPIRQMGVGHRQVLLAQCMDREAGTAKLEQAPAGGGDKAEAARAEDLTLQRDAARADVSSLTADLEVLAISLRVRARAEG